MVKSIEEIVDLIQAELLKPDMPIGNEGAVWLGLLAQEHRICLRDLQAAINLLANRHKYEGRPRGSLVILSCPPGQGILIPITKEYCNLRKTGEIRCISDSDSE
jgi:hypothetical protein